METTKNKRPNKFYKEGFREAAEVAAQYMYNFYDSIGGTEEDGIDQASEIYYYLTGEDLDVRQVLGVEPLESRDGY